MNTGVKLILGLIILVIGLYWYAAPLFGHAGVAPLLGVESTFQAFLTIFAGLFGLVLIFFGLIVSWIEWEDIKWAKRSKK